eukprot:CAMPEP_0117423742 /NCGR_PEP_ID=MMETSP0758-20121206/4296_1 /TAXON_ID=63605 /ORGANISM="Percolomonas cosmopolitus, Strain AE-1 (ATCC 50343)" /LENGTH=186 /DNA_ID=CAMNT_0005207095 /DNA_START=193 /DNA_END=753 /DNA_ORIENTATION=+
MYKKARRDYEQFKQQQDVESEKKKEEEEEKKRQQFERHNGMGMANTLEAKNEDDTGDGLFWLTSVMRDNQKTTHWKKPKKLFIDPMSNNQPLRSKQLVDVQFKKDCPLCMKPISNNINMVVLHQGVGYQGCGHAICKGCAKAFAKTTCPLCNTKVRKIIPIQAFKAGAGSHSVTKTIRIAPGFSNA